MTPRSRRLLAVATGLVLAATPVAVTAAAPTSVWAPLPRQWPAAPTTSAASYLLVDADTGQVLAEHAADVPRPVASTVKMLLALVVVEHAAPGDVVVVGDEVAVGGAGVGLVPGDRWTVEQLLGATIVRSGNDAARALAVHVGGSLEGGVELMRARAASLGLDGVVLADPTGLGDGNRLSARHLAEIARAYLDDPLLRRIAATDDVDLPSGREHTRNLLLDRYAEASGIKTGYTDRAGWCLVGSAVVDGRELVAVVLGARDDEARFDEAAALLDHGFGAFAAVPLEDGLRLRRAGRWVELPAPVSHVWAPGVAVTTSMAMPVAPGDRSAVTVVADDRVVARFERVFPDEATDLLGARLVDAVYRSLREAHRRDLWPDRPADVG